MGYLLRREQEKNQQLLDRFMAMDLNQYKAHQGEQIPDLPPDFSAQDWKHDDTGLVQSYEPLVPADE